MMYLKALQRPRRVPMRCSNEGFFNTTTNLVVSLLMNLIIFSFYVRSLLLVSRSALFLLLPLTLPPPPLSFFSLGLSSPSTFSIAPLRFPLIDPLFISAELRFKILPLSRTMLSLSLLFIFSSYLPFLHLCCLFCPRPQTLKLTIGRVSHRVSGSCQAFWRP